MEEYVRFFKENYPLDCNCSYNYEQVVNKYEKTGNFVCRNCTKFLNVINQDSET